MKPGPGSSRPPSKTAIPLFSIWASILALLIAALPVANPDVWWHLTAGRWIWSHGSIPATDPFSFTLAGARWIDFEWAFQLLLYPFGLAGDWGLWSAKALLLALTFVPIDGLLRDRKSSSLERAAGLTFWAAAILPKADLRPDLISAAFFAWQLRRLVARRASFIFGFLLFACWANCHAGFIVGLALYPAWAVIRRALGKGAAPGLGAEFCGAALGTLVNPYGPALYSIFTVHMISPFVSGVDEWAALSLRYRFHWPLAVAVATGLWAAWKTRRREPELALITLALSAATLASARFSVYWPAAAIPLIASTVAIEAALPALSVLLLIPLRTVAWGKPYQDRVVARHAVDFVVDEAAAFKPLRVFNTYEWGGYLGWRLGPEGKVFGDGRYLFHGQLDEWAEALSGEEAMAAFLGKYRLDAILVRNYPGRVTGVRVYPDGSRRVLVRPWYVSRLPLKRWALVWWDEQALVFVDRSKVPADWVKAHEYRWWRPGDDEALAAALEHGETTEAAVESERLRHSERRNE